MSREIKLSGGEISVLKAIGLSGSSINGRNLMDRASDLETAELIDTLEGLISADYVLASRVNVRTAEDIERNFFRANPAHARELREAISPRSRAPERERRRRRS